jgi:hypothetical protein
MASNQSWDSEQKPKGHLRNEYMLKAMPPDILQELARRRLAEIEQFKNTQENKQETRNPS